MELRELRYFLALADEGSFTRAAARCFVSQQALSQVVAALERRVGTALVHRRPRGSWLTPAGEQLALAARSLLGRAAEVDEVVARLRHREGDADADRPFRLGLLLDGLGPATVGVLTAFRAGLPAGGLRVRRVQPDEVFALLAADGLDAAFVHGPVPEQFGRVELFREGRVAALPAAGELADAVALRPDDLLLLSARARRPGIDVRWEGFFTLVGERGDEQPPRLGDPAGSLEELLWSIAIDGVFLTMPAHLASVYTADRFGIRYLPVPELTPVTFALAYRDGSADPRVALLARLARAALPDLLASLPAAAAVP